MKQRARAAAPTDQEDAFRQAIRDNPDDDALRLIFADWLEEHGDDAGRARAEFIRVQVRLAALPDGDKTRRALIRQQNVLLAAHRNNWLAGLPAPMHRGFVASFSCCAEHLATKKVAWLFHREPIETLELHGAGDDLTALAAWPAPARLTTLNLRWGHIHDAGVQTLAASPHLGQLTALLLHFNWIGSVGVRALADSPYLARLSKLDLSANSINEEELQATMDPARLPRLVALIRDDRAAEVFRALQHHTAVGDAKARALASSRYLTGITDLNLSGNKIGPAGTRALASSRTLTNLSRLDLSFNPVGDAGAAALASSRRLTRLTSLDLGRCEIGPAGVRALASSPNLVNLTRLNLRGNPVGDGGAEALAASPYLARLTELDVAYTGVG